ncbi:YiiX family permuted papain-like enzyme [Flavobacterium arcticum]|uniref:YiiX family permuted papain-like enzyme n=1 Tax=Flavobacterium arcticum TaxID=1784713 RepID=A0A345HDB0_9FLAO|nr:YiiX family permuted papain-like enzyme [Flavobacterium arcticum]AXG74570.1 YiiX family permuted papain-like enzyme [Flavobacterium arcticum]KAF2512310.1 YiiX family permuted papain-like enzyme [Flavobacterium arcticum]
MKKIVFITLIISFTLLLLNCNDNSNINYDVLNNGDIIFQTSTSAQSKAIQLATKSKYSHCGIIYKEGNDYFVYEAIQPVQKTPLSKWISRGENNHYVVKRLKEANATLTPTAFQKMKKAGSTFNNKNYDLYFEWSNERVYCSELVWKIYKEGTGLEVGKTQQLKEFDLSHPAVQEKIKERYGNNIPLNEKVISPAAIFESDLLYTVISE